VSFLRGFSRSAKQDSEASRASGGESEANVIFFMLIYSKVAPAIVIEVKIVAKHGRKIMYCSNCGNEIRVLRSRRDSRELLRGAKACKVNAVAGYRM
jgi:hypothetical protein